MKNLKSVNRISNHNYKNKLALTALLGIALVPSFGHAQSQTIYRETFQYCTSSLGKPAADQSGWFALVTGLAKERFGNMKVFSYGSSIVGQAVNSGPMGNAQGYSFWFKPTYGLSVLTTEFSFDVGLISRYPASVEYEQKLSGADTAGLMNQTQIAFLIDNEWYISGTATRQIKPGSWEPVKLDPSQLLYGKVAYVTGLGAAIPTAYNTSLPLSGTVQAFGVFVGEVNGRVRIDNFSISTTGPIPSSISTAVQNRSLSLCPASSPDVTGVVVPTPTPEPDDLDKSIDYGVPQPGLPTVIQAPVATPAANPAIFCATTEQGAGLRVRVGRSSQRAFITKGLPQGNVGLRDRFLAQLYATRSLPLGAVVNTKVGDFDRGAGVLKVTLMRGANPSAIRLTRPLQGSLKRYIASLGAGVSESDPLFGSATVDSQILNSKSAVCIAELRKIIVARGRGARIAVGRLFAAKSKS